MADYNSQVTFDYEKTTYCPYNIAHVVVKHRFAKHLEKCRRSYKGDDIKSCPFNASHRFPAPEIEHHVENCTDKVFLEIQVEKFQNSELKRQLDEEEAAANPDAKRRTVSVASSGNNSTVTHNAFDEENWDDDPPVFVDVKKRIEQSTLITHFQHETKSKREELRLKRHRQVVEMEEKAKLDEKLKKSSIFISDGSEKDQSRSNYERKDDLSKFFKRHDERSPESPDFTSNELKFRSTQKSHYQHDNRKVSESSDKTPPWTPKEDFPSKNHENFYRRERTTSRSSRASTSSYHSKSPPRSSSRKSEKFHHRNEKSTGSFKHQNSRFSQNHQRYSKSPQSSISGYQKSQSSSSRRNSQNSWKNHQFSDQNFVASNSHQAPQEDDWDEEYVMPQFQVLTQQKANNLKDCDEPEYNVGASTSGLQPMNFGSLIDENSQNLESQSESNEEVLTTSKVKFSSNFPTSQNFDDFQSTREIDDVQKKLLNMSRKTSTTSEEPEVCELNEGVVTISSESSPDLRKQSENIQKTSKVVDDDWDDVTEVCDDVTPVKPPIAVCDDYDWDDDLLPSFGVTKNSPKIQQSSRCEKNNSICSDSRKSSTSSCQIISSEENSPKNDQKNSAFSGTLHYETQNISSNPPKAPFNAEDPRNRDPMDYYDDFTPTRYQRSVQQPRRNNFNNKFSSGSSCDSFKTAKSNFSNPESSKDQNKIVLNEIEEWWD